MKLYLVFSLLVLLGFSVFAQEGEGYIGNTDAPTMIRFTTDGFSKPKGGHLQGVQQLSDRHLVISGSSKAFAYFFVVEWEDRIGADQSGRIISFITINDDFPRMDFNHAGGIQLLGDTLAIGLEGGKGLHRSSVVFYDLSNPIYPKVLPGRINRKHDTAGAVGMVRMSEDSVLVAVGGWDSDVVDFYISDQFPGPFDKVATFDSGRLPDALRKRWGSYQSLNLVKNGNTVQLYGFCRSGAVNRMDCYVIDWGVGNDDGLLRALDAAVFECGRLMSFRFGGGIAVEDRTDAGFSSSVKSVWVITRNWKREVLVGWFK